MRSSQLGQIAIAVLSVVVCQASLAAEPVAGDPEDAATVEEGFLQVPGREYDWLVVEPYGTVLKKVLWPDHRIPVCWDEPPKDSEEQRLRGVVRAAVEQSWQAHADIDFLGWGICADPRDLGVHIIVRDEMPRTYSIGRYLNMRPGGVVLNFELSQWRPACQPAETRDDCIRYLAVHEFGHVLGFVHEHLTKEAPAECRAEVGTRGARGNWKVTRYDRHSIMNYCSEIWSLYSGNVPPAQGQVLSTLSALDRTAVRAVYGARGAQTSTASGAP